MHTDWVKVRDITYTDTSHPLWITVGWGSTNDTAMLFMIGSYVKLLSHSESNGTPEVTIDTSAKKIEITTPNTSLCTVIASQTISFTSVG